MTITSKEALYKCFEKDNSCFVLAHWCGDEATEDALKEELKVTPRCVPLATEGQTGTCIFTGAENVPDENPIAELIKKPLEGAFFALHFLLIIKKYAYLIILIKKSNVSIPRLIKESSVNILPCKYQLHHIQAMDHNFIPEHNRQCSG